MMPDLEARVLSEEHHRRVAEAVGAAEVRGRRRAERRRTVTLMAGQRSRRRRRLRVAVAVRLRRWADRLEPAGTPDSRKAVPGRAC